MITPSWQKPKIWQIKIYLKTQNQTPPESKTKNNQTKTHKKPWRKLSQTKKPINQKTKKNPSRNPNKQKNSQKTNNKNKQTKPHNTKNPQTQNQTENCQTHRKTLIRKLFFVATVLTSSLFQFGFDLQTKRNYLPLIRRIHFFLLIQSSSQSNCKKRDFYSIHNFFSFSPVNSLCFLHLWLVSNNATR